MEGCPTVTIGDLPAARAGDKAFCEGAEYDVIVRGEPTVHIGGRPAARSGDPTDGGVLASGFATVEIGPPSRAAKLRRASAARARSAKSG